MRGFWIALLLPCAAAALDNAIRITDVAGAAQPGRPFTLSRWFAKDEICGYPQPYAGGTAVSIWQSDRINRWAATAACPGGSVQFALISFRADVPASSTVVVDFRNSTEPCSAGDASACASAGLSLTAALAFQGGTWDAQMTFAANPQGSTAAVAVGARTMMTDGNCWAYLKGPAATQYVCGPYNSSGGWNTSRPYAFGWRERRHAILSASFFSADTLIQVGDASAWASLPRPFKIYTDSLGTPERISICHVDSTLNRLYVGVTNGSSSSCASVTGRGQDGTTPSVHNPSYGNALYLIDSRDMRLASPMDGYTLSINMTDASLITPPARLKIGPEEMRVCNKAGNALTVGAGAAGCAGDDGGRRYRGTNAAFAFSAGTPIYLADDNDRWIDVGPALIRSVSPIFLLTFYPGWSGVGIEYVYENTWSDRGQDQEFDVTFRKSNPGVTVAVRPEVRLVFGSRQHYPEGSNAAMWNSDRKIWDGVAPGAVHYDFNLSYMRYSGAVPYDPTVVQSQFGINQELTINTSTQDGFSPAWDNGSKCALESTSTLLGSGRVFSGPVDRLWPSPGARADIGLNPRWYVSGLFAMASSLPGAERWYEWTIGTGYCAAYAPLHFTEGRTGTLFCNGGSSTADPSKSCSGANLTVDAFGFPMSRDARPTYLALNPNLSQTADRVVAVGHATKNLYAHSQSDGAAHMPSMNWIPYLLTGDWYFYWGLMHEGSWAGINSDGYPQCTNTEANRGVRQDCSHRDWMLPSHIDGFRNFAWAFRQIGRSAVAGIDGSPEKQYFTKKLNINIAVAEGKFNITNGSFYAPCPTPLNNQYDYSYWCWGRWFRGNGDPNMGLTFPGTLPHGGFDCGSQGFTYECASDWMVHYWLAAALDLENQGISQIRTVRTAVQKRMLNTLRNPAEHPNAFTVASYVQPWTPCLPEGEPHPGGCASQNGSMNTLGAQVAFSTWSNIYNAFPSAPKSWTNLQNDSDLLGGYARIAGAVASGLPDGVRDGARRGTSGWDWIQGNMRFRNLDGDNPMWIFSPKFHHEIRNVRVVDVSSNAATVKFVRPPNASSCSYVSGTSRPASTLTTGESTLSAGNLEMAIPLTGLSASTTYYVRITCRDARGEAVVVTEP